MAPHSGSRSGRRTGPDRNVVKTVVPVMPLLHTKRQAVLAASAVAPSRSSSSLTASQRTAEAAPAALTENGLPSTPDRCAGRPAGADAETNGCGPLSASPVIMKPGAAATEGSGAQQWAADEAGAHGQRPSPAADDSALQTYPVILSESLSAPNGSSANGVLGHWPAPAPVESLSAEAMLARPPPTMSPTRLRMPPPFQPSHQPSAATGNGDIVPGPPPHPPPDGLNLMHQPHPSNGSIHFGTFHDSQSSSPAPPLSGGTMLPPGMPDADARSAYVAHAVNGFPPVVPFGGEVGTFDGYGRPTMSFAQVDSFPPYGISYGPSTPRAFHGSHSPAPPKNSSMYAPFPPGATRGGGVVVGEDIDSWDSQRRLFRHPDHQRMPPSLTFTPIMAPVDDADGIADYLQQLFDSPLLADCMLELRYPDDRTPPVRITGHSLIFSRSAELSSQLHEASAVSYVSIDNSLKMIVLENDSRWMRSDAFYMAVQRLYGHPLLPMSLQKRTDSADTVDAGVTKEQFEFCLAYAAAGRLIGWNPVTGRGCEAASHLIGWSTLESGLEFALDGYSDKVNYESYKHGDASRTILDAVVAYTVHRISAGFRLDIFVEEPQSYARLPVYATPFPSQWPGVSNPGVLGGLEISYVHLGNGRRPQRVTNIQFGDLAVDASGPEMANGAQLAQSTSQMILSRVLLNLPFSYLKMILQLPGPTMIDGWTSIQNRSQTIKRVVEERESRRLRSLEAVTRRRVMAPDAIRAALHSPNPQDIGRWSALCWQEEILLHGNLEIPSLVRKWVPLMELHDGQVAEYP